MKFKLTKEDLRGIIKSYFLENENRIVEVNITTRKELTGLSGVVTSLTTIEIRQNVVFLGVNSTVSEIITKEKLTSIICELAEREGLSLESLEYDEGIHTRTVGYFMNESQEQTAYFKGIKVKANKVNSLSKKQN